MKSKGSVNISGARDFSLEWDLDSQWGDNEGCELLHYFFYFYAILVVAFVLCMY